MSSSQPTHKDQRIVRVFISSTFRDMMEEREELVKFTFPELRRRCRQRHVEFTGVDLRWGVTDEQKAEGKVLPICLEEIKRCHPFFVGLLGERFGWVPEKIDPDFLQKQDWLKGLEEQSITALEIQYGVLKDPGMKPLAYFYFRDPERSKKIEAELARGPGYAPEPESSRKKLVALKDRIRESGYAVRENYLDARTCGRLVLDDLWDAIDKRFPEEEVPSALERERLGHEAFAAVRRRIYIERPEYYKRLDDHVLGEGPPIVLLGDSGSGKSALVANWAEHYRQEHPDDFMLIHFIGGTADSADYTRIIRRMMEEIRNRYEPEKVTPAGDSVISGERDDIPVEPMKLVEQLPLWLAKTVGKGRFILILDALNQLEDRDNAPDLGWLPTYFPPHVRVILSTLPGRSLSALEKRNWPSMRIEALSADEKRTFITSHLKQYAKQLSPTLVDRIGQGPQTSNPLFLRTLLEEMQIYGDHFTISQKLDYYLSSESVEDLYRKILERWEQDYERDQPGLVKEAMSLIWASRRGLSETELKEILNISMAYWSPLYLAAEESLVSRSGLLNFFHDFLRKAVEDRYLPSLEIQRAAHLRLAYYFSSKDLDERKTDELPWQFAEMAAWERLKECIIDIPMFFSLWTDAKQYELIKYWLLLAGCYDIRTSYESALKKFEASQPPAENLAVVLSEVGSLLEFCGKYDDAEPFCRRSMAISEESLGSEHTRTIQALHSLASLLDSKGNYEEAETLFRRALHLRVKILGEEHADSASTMNSLAWVLRSKGNYEEAEVLFRKALRIREKVLGSEHTNTAESLNNLAALLMITNRGDEGEIFCRRSLAIWEKILGPEHPDTALSLNDLGALLFSKHDYEGAEFMLGRSLAIWTNALGPEHPRAGLASHNLAVLLSAKGDYDRAEIFSRAALSTWEKALGPEHPNTAVSLENLGGVLHKKGDHEGAESLLRRALAVTEKAFGEEHPQTADCLHVLAYILDDKGDHDTAELLYRRALNIREMSLGPEHTDTASTINNLANLLEEKGNYAEAEGLYRRALAINERALGQTHPDTARSRHNLACLLAERGFYKEGEALSRRALAVWEKTLGLEHIDTAKCISGLASILQELGDYEQAESLFRRALVVKENTLGSEHPETARSLNDLAVFLEKQGDYEASEILCRKALAIREKVKGPEHPETADSVYCLSSLLERKGEIKEAEVLCRKALAMWEKPLGKEHPKISLGLDKLGSILEAGGDYEEAKHLHRRALGIKEKVLGPDHPDTLKTLGHLLQIAFRFRDRGDQARAAELFRLVLGTYERTSDTVREKTPQIITNMATCHNELAFHTHVPAKHWEEAEYHYRQATDLFKKAGDAINAANVEMNLQTLFHLSGQPVDFALVKELIRILEEANDPRAEKGHKLLEELQ